MDEPFVTGNTGVCDALRQLAWLTVKRPRKAPPTQTILRALAGSLQVDVIVLSRQDNGVSRAVAYCDRRAGGPPVPASLPLTETPCHLLLDGLDSLAIEDMAADERCAALAVCTVYGMRSYSGVPVLQRDGAIFGTLCAMHHANRRIDPEEAGVLALAGYLLMQPLEVEMYARQRRIEGALRASEDRYRQMFERNQAVKLVIDAGTGMITDANQAAIDFYGYDLETFRRTSISEINMMTSEELCSAMEGIVRGEDCTLTRQHRLASGEVRDVEIHSGPLSVEGRTLLYSIIHDITDRRRAEEALRESERRFRAIFESAPFGIELANKQGELTHTNAALQRMLGYSADELRNMNYQAITHPDDIAAEDALDDSLVAGTCDTYQLEKRHIRKDGEALWTRLTATLVRSDDGESQFAVGVVEDISGQRQAAEALRRSALHDPLTDLPNRTLLRDRLERALIAARRTQVPVALLFMDLDRFKEINDTLGHQCGDQLLQQLGERLTAALREGDTVARLGGDEFAVLLIDADREGAERAAGRIMQALSRPFTVECNDLPVEASIGIALYPEDSNDATTIMRHADVAMYQAKRTGSGFALYAAEHDLHSPSRLALLGELRGAIGDGELSLQYQPKLSLLTGEVQGVEALARWNHPQRGMIPPGEFIGLAEHTGLMKPLTLWVLNEALRQCRQWHDGGLDLRVAINLSPRTLHDPSLAGTIVEALQRHRADPRWLELEITEGAIMVDTDRSLLTLSELHEMGVGISIDDFGTGYSSLAYLKRLPIDEIKIDKSFILDMALDEGETFIARSVIDLGHSLGLEVVAEGVENQRILDILAAMGCDQAQGYHLSRPLPPEAITDWLRCRSQRKSA